MAELPTPLITEILSKLPGKSLLRFRSVARSWRTLIDGQDFINLHLKNSLQNPKHHTLIIKDCFLQDGIIMTNEEPFIYSVDYPTLNRATLIYHPFDCGSFEVEILGSCNGLLCLGDRATTVIFNPLTRKYRVLPTSDIEMPGYVAKLPHTNSIPYGFGYDQINDYYKLVRIVELSMKNSDIHCSEVKVYSLKANSWRRVRDFPNGYYIGNRLCWAAYVNGCLHWVVVKRPESDGSQFIVAFDIGREVFKVVPQPKYDKVDSTMFVNVGVLDRCLRVMAIYAKVRTDVWIMKEYGVEKSWTKLFSVPQCESLGLPVAYRKQSGFEEVLFEKDFKKLLWFDVKRRKSKTVKTRGLPWSFDSVLLVESLVSLEIQKKKKKAQKKRLLNAQPGQVSGQLATLPMVLLYNILSRLPAVTLLQLRCVCNKWNNVLNKPDFAKMHLEVSGESSGNLNLIIREEKLHLVDLNLNKAVQVNHPLTCPEGWTDIVGSCNGLLCLSNQDKDIALWNPLSGICHKLPVIEPQSEKDSDVFQTVIYGFGYDPISDDYKVVHILQCYSHCGYDEFGILDSERDNFACSEAHVYSLKAKYWRSIDCFPYIICYASGVFASGALHWVARRRHDLDSSSFLIMAFDLGLEKCREVQQPEYDDIYFHMSLGLLGGSLCIICTYPKHGVDIWLMKDSNCSCKLISITQPRPIKFFEYIKPLVYSTNRAEVLLELDYKEFIWYNLQKKTIRQVNIRQLPNSFGTEVFSGSLIDPNNIDANSEKQMGWVGTDNLSHKNHQIRNDSVTRQEKQPRKLSSLLASLPEKVLCHIFSLLPVKTLVRVQHVCKTRYNLMNGPDFIKMHLEVSRKCNSGSLLILKGNRWLSVNSQLLDKAIEIDHPVLCSDDEYTDIVGSCNGLICLCKDHNFALWNPCTGKYEKIPNPDFHFEHVSNVFHCLTHGLGYDPSADDYKIVSILQQHNRLKGGTVHTAVQVYSSKTKSWKQIQHFCYFVCYPCNGVFTSGALHWVARQVPDLYSSSNLLIAFDLGVEKCRVVKQPNYVDTDFHMSLGLLGGSLCFLCHYPKESFDLWVMADYPTESWTKLISISQPNIIRCFEYMKPLAYSKDGSEVLFEQDNEKLLWYNLRKKAVKYVKIPGLPKAFDLVMCSSSLVPVGNFTRNYQVIHESNHPSDLKRVETRRKGHDLEGFLSKGFKLKL
ncbi:hypothetical protein OROGR_020654 [Orobanche gracilis]